LGGTESSGPVTGQPILDAVVARLPTAPLDIHGDITVRKRRGVVLQVLKFDMALNWGASPSSALYTIRDSFGKELENMLIQQSRDTGVRVAYHAGDVEAAAQNLPLHTQIQETDISWADLTLAFLWWPNSRIVGQDNARPGLPRARSPRTKRSWEPRGFGEGKIQNGTALHLCQNLGGPRHDDDAPGRGPGR